MAKTKGNMAMFLGGSGELNEPSLLEEAMAAYRELGDMFHLADSLMALEREAALSMGDTPKLAKR